jgi:hypothetical protein
MPLSHLLLILSLFLLPPQAEEVLICQSGTAYAYHARRCQGLQECTHVVEKVTLKEALQARRTPCGYCYVKVMPGVPAGDGQCRAQTKKGSRCSRKGTYAGFCHQHRGG